jgi:hypothetical protein
MKKYGKIRYIGILITLLVLMSLVSSCTIPNHIPEIVSLEASRTVLDYSDSCLIECLAYDQDGDEMNYDWKAEDGRIRKISDKGNQIAWTAPKKEGVFLVTVEVEDGKQKDGQKTASSLEIKVKNNHAPEITELTVDKEWLTPLEIGKLSASAEDQDGDNLQYEWSSEAGELSGVGQSVQWQAPDTDGVFQIKVIVTDGFGKKDERIITISVASRQPPTIIDVRVIPEEPKYFKEKNGRYVILRERKCILECVVEDNYDGLTYEWSDGGNSYTGPSSNNQTAFSGVGSNVTWQAPDKTKDLNITVKVYDEFGNVASEIIPFSVVSCACAF